MVAVRDPHAVLRSHRFLLMLEFYWLFDPVVFDQTIFVFADLYLHSGTGYCNIRVFVLVAPNHMEICSFHSNKFCKTYDI
jgi:hypothetical protein